MATQNTASTVSAWLKEIYADSLQNLIPEGVRLVKAVKFSAGEKEIGDKYVQPVALTHEFGFTVGSGAFSLNDAVAATYAEAQVEGKNLLLRTQVSYDAMAKASSSKKAFMKWSEQVIGNMTASFTKRLEILHFYGGTSIGKVESEDGAGALTLYTSSWASGIWAGSEGMQLEAFTALTAGTQHAATLTITAVDLVSRIVTVTSSATVADVNAEDFLFFKGFRGSEMNGIDLLTTTTSTIYNISPTSYALWKGNSSSAGDAKLTFKKIQHAVALAVAKGLDEKVTVYCSPTTFADLNSDLSALQRMDSSYKKTKGEQGHEAISFYGVNGEIEVCPSIYVKEGEAFCVPVSKLKRIGSSDVTMRMPGQSEDQLVLQMPSNAGYEMRLFYDGNLFCERPAWLCKITNIVNG
jgi:hypothetical protein